MNPASKVQEATDALANLRRSARKYITFADWAEANLLPIVAQLSETPTLDLSCAMPWIHVYNREDLSRLMTLAPKWDKTKTGTSICYSAIVQIGPDPTVMGSQCYFTIHAHDAALPPTCKVVKETVVIPATEAREEVRETIVCELHSAELADVTP